MGRKQAKGKKFNRNVDISAPILDPEVIKAIHTPPKFGLDPKQGGFKALLAGLNSQDSTEEIVPVCNPDHVPSYIGISCAISGYSSYSKYKSTGSQLSTDGKQKSRPISPCNQDGIPITHITIDKNNINDPEKEFKELTSKLTASLADKRRSPSPNIAPPTDGRHHGAYVGARYAAMPPPSQDVVKHIPLLGIDDDKDPEEALKEQEKSKGVEKKIASIYGEEFVEEWKESMTHKSKKELPQTSDKEHEKITSPRDLVSLKQTPAKETVPEETIDIEKPNVKVMEKVEKPFLAKITGFLSPKKKSPAPSRSETPHFEKDTESSLQKKNYKKSSSQESPAASPTLIDPTVKRNSPKESENLKENKSEHNVLDSVQLEVDPQPESKNNDVKNSDDKVGQHYLDIIEQESSKISERIAKAETFLNENLNEDITGMIMSAVGKANLIINDKFIQFKKVCNKNIQQDADEQFATLNNDLEGMWDVIIIQVKGVHKSFDEIEKAKENNWILEKTTVEDESDKNQKSKDIKQPKKPKLNAEKDNERRKKLQEHISKMKASANSKTNEAVDPYNKTHEEAPAAVAQHNDSIEEENSEQVQEDEQLISLG